MEEQLADFFFLLSLSCFLCCKKIKKNEKNGFLFYMCDGALIGNGRPSL